MTFPNRDDRFYQHCLKYARARWPQHADDFAGEAWIMQKRWPGVTIKQCWASYLRKALGVPGFAKHRVEKAISYGQQSSGVPTRIAQEKIVLPYLTELEQAFRILLEEGFDYPSLARIFKVESGELRAIRMSIQKKIIRNDPDIAEKFSTKHIIREMEEHSNARRKKKEKSVELSLSEFADLLEG